MNSIGDQVVVMNRPKSHSKQRMKLLYTYVQIRYTFMLNEELASGVSHQVPTNAICPYA